MPYKDIEKRRQCRNDSDARRRYGISSYVEMLKIRNQSCMICGKRSKRMHIDHDHKGPNRTYRGVLCSYCNEHLGWYEHFQSIILNYIKK